MYIELAKGLLTRCRNIWKTRHVCTEQRGARKSRGCVRQLHAARHDKPSLLDGEDDRIQGLLATLGVDLKVGLGLFNGIQNLLESLVIKLFAG